MHVCQVCGSLNANAYTIPNTTITMWLCPEHAMQRGLWYTR